MAVMGKYPIYKFGDGPWPSVARSGMGYGTPSQKRSETLKGDTAYGFVRKVWKCSCENFLNRKACQMPTIDILQRLVSNWTVPRTAMHHGEPTEFKLRCLVEKSTRSIDSPKSLPRPLAELWNFVTSARLFEDFEFGQWGLLIHSPEDATNKTNELMTDRPKDYREGDIVIGQFLGDQDLLIVRADPLEADYGQIVVALPLDSREDWYIVGDTLDDFFEKYEKAEGAKYWER